VAQARKTVRTPRGGDDDMNVLAEIDPVRPGARETVGGVPRLLVLGKARSILDAFSFQDPQLSLAELVVCTGLPTSTCLRLIRNLTHEGLLERVGDKYQIGLTIVRWASSALEGRSVIATAAPTLDWLRDSTEESALLCVREGAVRVIVGLAKSRHTIVRQLHVGEVLPLHVGSTAKVFLAFDPGAVDASKGQQLQPYTPFTTTDNAKLAREVEKIRADGYAVSEQEGNIGALGISAPVYDRGRHMVAAVGITGPIQRMAPDHIERYVPAVLEAAHRVSRALGYDNNQKIG
jgi:IclR family transcriptional regulator, acetate operon repressor